MIHQQQHLFYSFLRLAILFLEKDYTSYLESDHLLTLSWNFFFDPFPPFRIRVAVRQVETNEYYVSEASEPFPERKALSSWILIHRNIENILRSTLSFT